MKCKNCGAEISDTALFCSECGTAVRTAAPARDIPVQNPTANTEPASAEPVNASDTVQPSYEQPTYRQPYNSGVQPTYSQSYQQPNYDRQNYDQPYSSAPQQGQQYQQYSQTPKNTTPTLSIVGLVLGILSILCCCSYIGGLLFGIPGVILAVLGNKDTKTGVGTAAMVCSIIGIALSLLLILFTAAAGMDQNQFMETIFSDYGYYY